MANKVIYLDNQSTTQIDPIVLKSMYPYLTESYGNPASSNHLYGWQAEEAVLIARENVSKLINSKIDDIIFTSGATESINLAMKGLLGGVLKKGDHIITTNIEHKAVIDVLYYLENKGISISYLPVNPKGNIDLNDIKNNICDNTKLCTIIHGNNEIGTVQDIKKIGEICKSKNIIFHVDAAQTLGKREIDVNEMNIDLLSVSGHKIYAPKGVGALYINRINSNVNVNPLIHGGGHENGFRSGTLSVHNIVGFGEACKIAFTNMNQEKDNLNKMRNKLINGIKEIFPNVIINGNQKNILEGNINITFPNLKANYIISNLTNLAFSTSSACMSINPKPSHVLKAIGLNDKQIENTIRLGIGRFNNMEEINQTIRYFKGIKND
tara:strand:+ start:3590 stop:4732 length:1143 start_codon:yes stop_codon:yes gene_type:complete